MSGGHGAHFSIMRASLEGLESTLSSPSRKTFASLRHDGPEDDGGPDLVAKELRYFFLRR